VAVTERTLRRPLLTDLYQLNMIKAYLDHGQTADTFDLVVVG
jgi:nicotinic acid phosphoribosyltransferase